MTDRNEFIERFKTQLGEWDTEIEKIEAQAQKAQAAAKVQYEENLKKLREQRDEGYAKMRELQQASDAAWDDIREGAEKMWTSAQETFRNAWSRFS